MIADEKGQAKAEDGAVSGEGDAAPAPAKRRRGSAKGDPHVSSALRTAYQATVQEDVPSEFLDLLGKLS